MQVLKVVKSKFQREQGIRKQKSKSKKTKVPNFRKIHWPGKGAKLE